MLIDSSNMQPSVNVYPNGGFMGGNGGFGDSWGGNGFFWILILFFFAMFAGWGNNGYASGNNGGAQYVPYNAYVMMTVSYSGTVKAIMIHHGSKYNLFGTYPGMYITTAQTTAVNKGWTLFSSKTNRYFYRANLNGEAIYLVFDYSNQIVNEVTLMIPW